MGKTNKEFSRVVNRTYLLHNFNILLYVYYFLQKFKKNYIKKSLQCVSQQKIIIISEWYVYCIIVYILYIARNNQKMVHGIFCGIHREKKKLVTFI